MQDDLDGLLICFSSISQSCCCGNVAWLKGHKSCVGCRHHTGELGYWGLEPNAIGRLLARLQGTRFRKPVDALCIDRAMAQPSSGAGLHSSGVLRTC